MPDIHDRLRRQFGLLSVAAKRRTFEKYLTPERMKMDTGNTVSSIISHGNIPDTETMAHPSSLLSSSALDIFLGVTGKSAEQTLRTVLDHSLFLDPKIVREIPAYFSDGVRESREFHPGVRKGGVSTWLGQPVKVYDNTRAREAVGRYIGRKMGSKDREVAVGWEVAHVWGRVYDPEYFTAGWNMILMPGFLRLMTEEQAKLALFGQSLQHLAHNLYFASGLVPLPKEQPKIVDPNSLPEWVRNYRPQIISAASLRIAA